MKALRDILPYLSAPPEAELGPDPDWRAVFNADRDEAWGIEPSWPGSPETWQVFRCLYDAAGTLLEGETFGRFAARSAALLRLAEIIPADVELRAYRLS